jgi:hypothetical protein
MSVVRKFIVLVIVVISSAEVWGQAARSPFTTYGIGESYGNALIHNQGMGGLGVSQPQFWYLNNQNPALLVYNTLTVFEAGIVGESRKVHADTVSEKTTGGNMNYLVTAFPVKPGKWTTSVGLMPYTNVDFAFVSNININDVPVEIVESGSGGLTQLYWSNGVRLTPEISVGLKAAYLFGPIDNVYSNQLLKSDQVPYIVSVEQKTTIKNFNYGLGFSFSRDSLWGKNYRLSVGAVYNFEASLNAKRNDSFFRTTVAGDTLENYDLNTVRGDIHVPANITAGITISRGMKWSVGTEFMYQNWANFKSISEDDEGLGKAWRVILGGEYTPDPFAMGSFLKRITYRTGGSFERYPFMANGKTVKDIGINFGLSLPTGRSSIDMAVKFGKRGDKAQNILEETYFKIYFGLTFNDQWFIKRKFD